MKNFNKTATLFVLISILLLSQVYSKERKKSNSSDQGQEQAIFTVEDYKKIFEQDTQWSSKKPIMVRMKNAYDEDIDVYSHLKIDSDFNSGLAKDSTMKLKHSYISPFHNVVEFNDPITATISLDDLIIEFEEDQKNVKILVGGTEQRPVTQHDFHSYEEFLQDQKTFIEQKGLFEKMRMQKDVDEEKKYDDLTNMKGHINLFLLPVCIADSGIHEIKGKIYPYLFEKDENIAVTFSFYKDCSSDTIKNPNLEVSVDHYCHHHDINEQTVVWEKGNYGREYVSNPDENTKNSIRIDRTDPKIRFSIQEGNAFAEHPKIQKIEGKKSNNIIDFKKNRIGGYFSKQHPLLFQIVTKCEDLVGEEKWRFSIDILPFSEKLTFDFVTQCNQKNEINNFTDFPLIIGTEGAKDNVVRWGIANDQFNISPEHLKSNKHTLKQVNYETKQISFTYGYTVSSKQEEVSLDLHGHTVTIHDTSVLKIVEMHDPSVKHIDEQGKFSLTLHMWCLKRGKTIVDVHQKFDYLERKIEGQPVEFGFEKICEGFDYANHFGDDIDEGGNFQFFLICALLIGLAIYALKCISSKNSALYKICY